jgi:hypothetical protein
VNQLQRYSQLHSWSLEFLSNSKLHLLHLFWNQKMLEQLLLIIPVSRSLVGTTASLGLNQDKIASTKTNLTKGPPVFETVVKFNSHFEL